MPANSRQDLIRVLKG